MFSNVKKRKHSFFVLHRGERMNVQKFVEKLKTSSYMQSFEGIFSKNAPKSLRQKMYLD